MNNLQKKIIKYNFLTLLIFIFPLLITAQNRGAGIKPKENQKSQKCLALVIGNGDYANARKLSNPVNDATDMAKTLKELDFEVISGTNLKLKQMTDKVREFGDKLKTSGGIGLFYYAGHGIQVNGRNYLIPVEADIPREDEVASSSFDLEFLLRKLNTANNGFNIVVLDACRTNPFARSWSRNVSDDGLAQISAPKGTFIAYATSPDETADDGIGRNGLYTAELLKFLKQPGLKIEETFKEVTKAVDAKSRGKQTPWVSSSLRGEFVFKPLLKKEMSTEPDSNPNSIAATQSSNVLQSETNSLPNRSDYIPMTTISILFDSGSAVLSLQGKAQLDELVIKAFSTKGYIIEIQGYADVKGSKEANIRLSQLRAQEVIDYLVIKKDIPLRRIGTAYGMGENDPVADSRTDESLKQSRRVEVRVLVRSGN